jgi:hypothetical protein
MSKTTIRGSWPTKQVPKDQVMKLIKEAYVPPDKQIYTRGKSEYSPFIKHLMSGKPGALAVECVSMKVARGLGHALARYLKHENIYEKIRPRIRKDSPECVKVWVVAVDAKAQ